MYQVLFDLLQGILVGLVISLPLGPVAIITMKRAADYGLRAGVISGLAIALIDTVAALGILFGLHQSAHYVRPLPPWVHIIGAVIIFLYGLRIMFTDPVRAIAEELPWHKHFFGSMLIAITNPTTYVSFGVIGLLLSRFLNDPLFARMTVGAGFFLGAIIWWITLATIAFSQRSRYLNAKNIHRAVGLIIMFLAILILLPLHVNALSSLTLL